MIIMADSIRPIVSIDPEDTESFRVMIDARTRHADLWPLVRQLGSSKKLAEAIGVSQSTIGKWVNLIEYPSRLGPASSKAVECLHTLADKTYDELWPPGLRRAIDEGRASRRAAIAIESTVINELAARQAERLILPDPSETIADEEVRQIIGNMGGLFESLKENEKTVLKLRFGLGEHDGTEHTFEECGRILKISKERVRQIQLKAMLKLHKLLTKDNPIANPTLAALVKSLKPNAG